MGALGDSDEGQSERWLSKSGEASRERGNQAGGRWEGSSGVPEWLAGESPRGTTTGLDGEIRQTSSGPT